MPRVKKKQTATKALDKRAYRKRTKLIRKVAEALLAPPSSPVGSWWKRDTKYNLELLPVEDFEPAFPLEPTVKQESGFSGEEIQFLDRGEVEIKEELLDPEVAGEPDPIEQDGFPLSLPAQVEDNLEIDNRCQFCLNLFRESGGRGIITKVKIGFVLGLSDWDTNPGKPPDCCEGCRKMFDLFYEFKQSCLTALARPVELFVWAGKKGPAQFADMTSNVRSKSMSMGPKTNELQQMQDLHGLEISAKQESFEPGPVSTAVHSVTTVLGGNHVLEMNSEQEGFGPEVVSAATHSEEEVCVDPIGQYPTESNESGTKHKYNSRVTIVDTTYCGRCRKWFSNKEVYAQHKPGCIETHKINKPSPPEFTCPLCPQRYKYQQELNHHIDRHNGIRSIPCRRESCTKMFFHPAARERHEETHKLNKPPPPEFACHLCPKKFKYHPNLNYHIDRHNGLRSIPCRREDCTKMFYHPASRKAHEQLCGQEVQETCSVCGSIFRSKSALRAHAASHGNPKFLCEICNKGFYRKGTLQKHVSAHERKFDCKICGKHFESFLSHRGHQRVHRQEKRYTCHICGQRFTFIHLLKAHQEKGHETVMVPEPVALPSAEVLFPPNPFGF